MNDTTKKAKEIAARMEDLQHKARTAATLEEMVAANKELHRIVSDIRTSPLQEISKKNGKKL